MPDISIVIPAHNEAHFLTGLFDSIETHLTVKHEVIVVNNGSTDNTAEIISRYKHQAIFIEDKVFPSVARNTGAKQANTQILVFLDADVIITESWAKEIESLVNDERLQEKSALLGESYHISTKPSWIEHFWFEPLRKKGKNYINGGNIVIAKSDFDRINGFDEFLETGEDVELSERALSHGMEILFIPELIVHHEGFPKKIGRFFARERWHGKGDFLSISHFIASKVAIIASLFLFSYLLVALSLIHIFFAGITQSSLMMLVCACGIIFILCITSSFMAFKDFGVKQMMMGAVIYFIYFNGRMMSLIDVMKQKYLA